MNVISIAAKIDFWGYLKVDFSSYRYYIQFSSQGFDFFSSKILFGVAASKHDKICQIPDPI